MPIQQCPTDITPYPLAITNHLFYNFSAMDMATNEISFTTTSTVFAAIVTTVTDIIPDDQPITISSTSFQAVVYASVAMVDLAATTGPDTIHSESKCNSCSDMTK